MKKRIGMLFDMDGVVIDTEPQYDQLWRAIGNEYVPGIEEFEKIIKGTTLPNIMGNYFPHLSEKEKQKIRERVHEFELKMDFFEIPGAVDFVRSLKGEGFPVGLVTSSGEEKVLSVFRKMNLAGLFDTVVTAEKITSGKPDPMCYLLAASNIGVNPTDCYVFEDSLAGIESGTRAGMTVIGLSTTHPSELLKDKVTKIIPDFKDFNIDYFLYKEV